MFGMAQAAVLDGGRVIVPAVGRPESEPIEKARAWVHLSADGGETFSPAVRISEVAAEPLAGGNGATGRELPGGGHYAGLAARADGAFQVVWCDSRSGRFQPYTASVQVGG